MSLDFASLRRVKRKRELAWLEERFTSILAGSGDNNNGGHLSKNEESNSTAAVLLQATAGTGKSTLLQTFLQDIVQDKALICCGKFEERTAAQEPFAAIIAAMDTLIAEILQSGEGRKWGKRICQSLDVEIDLLEDLFPSFHGIIKASRSVTSYHSGASSHHSQHTTSYFEGFGSMTDKEWRFERLRLAMRALVRCLSLFAPMVFCLEDLHWADPDSLALIRTLLLDQKKGRQFLFVGTARPEPIVSNFPLDQVEVLSLSGLTVEEITEILIDLYRQTPDYVQPLAECLQQQTGGNAFGVFHVLRRLEEQEQFTWDDTTNCWRYDMDHISRGITMVKQPTEMVRESLQNLAESERQALVMASAFGTTYFEVGIIVHAMVLLEQSRQLPEAASPRVCEDSVDPYIVQQRVREMTGALHRLEEKGFVLKQPEDGHYKFAHHSVREAAYLLLSEGRDRQQMHLRIGRQLRLWMDSESEFGTSLSQDSLLLFATKHLDKAIDLIKDSWELVDVAELNYQAAEMVAGKSSFFLALEYLQFGAQILRSKTGNSWTNHYDLSLKLNVALTRVQYCLGLYDECLRTVDDLLAHGKGFTREERVVYHTKIFCLSSQNRKTEALEVGLDVLRDLGENLPRRFLQMHIGKEYKKTAKLLNGRSDKELLSLPRVNDDKLNETIEFLERIAELARLGAEPAYFNLFSFRLIHLTIEKGLFPLSTFAFISWAMCLADMGNHDEATRFGRLAFKLADEGLGRASDTRTKFVYWINISHLRRPYQDALEPMILLMKDFWHYSAVDYAVMHVHQICRLGLGSGYDLRSVLLEVEKCGELCRDYNQLKLWRRVGPIHQVVLNLVQPQSSHSHLRGEVMNEDVCRVEWSSDAPAIFVIDLMSMFVSCFFNDYERALEAVERMNAGEASKSFSPDCWVPLRIFYSGLVSATLSAQKKYWSQRKRAESQLLQLRMWSVQGNVACHHMYLILEAQLMRLQSKVDRDSVVSVFDQASQAAAEVYMTHHQALAHELAARFLKETVTTNATTSTKSRRSISRINNNSRNSSGEDELLQHHLDCAVDLYKIWGAAAKAQQLLEDFQVA